MQPPPQNIVINPVDIPNRLYNFRGHVQASLPAVDGSSESGTQ